MGAVAAWGKLCHFSSTGKRRLLNYGSRNQGTFAGCVVQSIMILKLVLPLPVSKSKVTFVSILSKKLEEYLHMLQLVEYSLNVEKSSFLKF